MRLTDDQLEDAARSARNCGVISGLTREEAERRARDIYLRVCQEDEREDYISDALMEVQRQTIEECAGILEKTSAKLLAPKRTTEIDRHVAYVLAEHAREIRALKDK